MEVRDSIIKYLKAKVPKFVINKRGKVDLFSCPKCGQHSANFINDTATIICLACNFKGAIGNIIELLDPDKSVNDVLESELGLPPADESDRITKAFEFYQANHFSVTPLAGKKALEADWTNKTHYDIEEWIRWKSLGLNFGIRTGSVSGIVVLDFDSKDIPSQIKSLLTDTLVQTTRNGYHYFYKYVGSLRKCKIVEAHMDLETDGGQVVAYPSKVEYPDSPGSKVFS